MIFFEYQDKALANARHIEQSEDNNLQFACVDTFFYDNVINEFFGGNIDTCQEECIFDVCVYEDKNMGYYLKGCKIIFLDKSDKEAADHLIFKGIVIEAEEKISGDLNAIRAGK